MEKSISQGVFFLLIGQESLEDIFIFLSYSRCFPELITCRKPIEATRSPREVDFVLWWMLLTVDASSLGAISYMDCIGKDKYGEERKKNFKLAGENGMNRCHLMSIKKSQEIGHQLGYCL
ncbi:uncharacterized protein LOC130730050 isoform X3 [Lotus japonicus]|uniref:uncharacterized protein LOC130723087 isoform X3 n=1 Tax=Lotus japonicus TaxID=34305 RepID=UPI002588D4BD|nr:uncharacterized protein LOC130723087 isoform X3 [Lotus japonicus]XP_057437916.1 uncharacterized protein LOC130730050 isoform X3 [Lotus japonicus]XP_057437917.1 uncharacterized protein LOC130730050 isoform X3 [Lotus japonicus]